jgi:hypothetical protein
MQIKSINGYSLGQKTKSHMAEFSANPDARNKRDISYQDSKKRKKIEDEENDFYRIQVNKVRNSNNLSLFTDIEEFEDLIEESNFKGEVLWKYLITYKEGVKNTIDETKDEDNQIFVHKKFPAISSKYLSYYIQIKHHELVHLNKQIEGEFYYILNEEIQYIHNLESILMNSQKGYLFTYQRVFLFSLMFKWPDKQLKLLRSLVEEMDQVLSSIKINSKKHTFEFFTTQPHYDQIDFLKSELEKKLD